MPAALIFNILLSAVTLVAVVGGLAWTIVAQRDETWHWERSASGRGRSLVGRAPVAQPVRSRA